MFQLSPPNQLNSTMLALSPPLFSTFGWPLEDSISHETSESFLHFPSTQEPQLIGVSESTVRNNGESMMVKKLNHNASERDRRKRINNLYSTLRSLLPAADHETKKLSIPATVSRVLKYIPELQKEVERLVKKKEELSSRFSRQCDLVAPERQRQVAFPSTKSIVSASPLGDGEVVTQISTAKDNNIPFSEVLLNLEEDGLFLLNSSSFESSGGLIFHILHLQIQEIQKMEFEKLREKLLSLYEKWEELTPREWPNQNWIANKWLIS